MRKVTLLLILTAAVLSASASAATVAYWRFEEGPLGANVVRGGLPDGTWYPGAMDSSGNGYSLSAWSDGGFAGEGYRSMVPITQVPQTHAANTFCLQSTGDVPGMWTNDPALDTWKPTTWSVEAWAYCTSINNWRVVVGRDGDDIAGDQPAFRIMFTNANAVRASFCDMSNTHHELNTTDQFVVGNRWYHLAATSDGTNFILYVDGVEVARKLLNSTDVRLSDGSNGRAAGGDWHQGAWTVFRGMWNGGHTDRWYGYIDEVRISDTALMPAEFLNSGGVLEGPRDWAVFPEDVTTATFTVNVAAVPYGHTMTDIVWYKDSPDPNTLVAADGLKYSINTTANQSTLTIYDVTGSDETDYHAKAFFSDGSSVNSTRKAHLFIRSGLVHRWSFSGNVMDSIGGADGVIIDPNNLTSFVEGDTQLLLNNPAVNASPADVNNISYVELPAGIISPLDNFMTIEMWLTPHRNANWTTFFAFGDTWNAEPFVNGFTGCREGILAQLNRDQDGARGPSFTRVAPGGSGRNMTSSTILTLDEEFMYTVTWNGNTNTMRHFVNGVQVDSDAIDMKLSDIDDVKCWLGVPFWGDAVLNASLNELRIYDTALPSYYINAHYIAGPDVTTVELKPAVAAPAGVGVYPGLRADDEDSAELTAAVTDKPIGTTVANAVWFKDIDPEISGDEVQLSDDAKYDISWTDEGTTLKVNSVISSDEAYYYAKVTLNTGASGTSGSGKLTVSQGLVHRWSFSGDLTDSVGGANGTLVDPSALASFVSGQLQLDNPASGPNADPTKVAYVSLPAGLVSALDNYATIEMWVTPLAERTNWTNLFAFGSDRDGDPANYTGGDGIVGSLRSGGINAPLFSYDIGGAQRWETNVTPPVGEEFLFAMVWDGNANVGTLYVVNQSGTVIATSAINGNRVLANINDNANIIGGNWWNDYMLNGSINEMRIYDWAYDRAWIEEHYVVGPDTVYVNPCVVRPQFDLAGGGEFGDEPDCKVDMSDFAAFAQEWLECGRLEGCL